MTVHATAFDLDAIHAKLATARRASEGARAFARYKLLKSLRAVGVTHIEAHYDGYGDSGNIENVFCTPPEIKPSQKTLTKIEDFLWFIVTKFHAGFENNAGGYGELSWDIETNRLLLDHNERIEDVECYSYEDI